MNNKKGIKDKINILHLKMNLINPIKVLLVDDNTLIRLSFRHLLRSVPNLKVVGECSDGSEVITFLENNKVDLIFMDIVMKNVDGFQATRKVKENYPHVKVIAFSSLDYNSSADRMKKSGADGFISKFEADKSRIISELKKIM